MFSDAFVSSFRQLFKKKSYIEQKAKAIERLFDSLDRQIRIFEGRSRLRCEQGCGHCCENPGIEATELEMLPMAFALVRRGEADRYYNEALSRKFSGCCVMFRAAGPDNGSCGAYEARPLVCRLFGFSANRDKHGRLRMVTCSRINSLAAIDDELNDGRLDPPVMTDFFLRAEGVDPDSGRERLHINLALKRAIDKVRLYEQLQSGKQR